MIGEVVIVLGFVLETFLGLGILALLIWFLLDAVKQMKE